MYITVYYKHGITIFIYLKFDEVKLFALVIVIYFLSKQNQFNTSLIIR